MRLVSIFNAWSDCDLLPKAIQNILPVVDGVIVVWSNESNRGQFREFHEPVNHPKVTYFHVEPTRGYSPSYNETLKRNFGISQAKKEGYTHFLLQDGDELYFQSELMADKLYIEENNLNGMVHPIKVYIKKPTLWCFDHTLVPGIQKLTKEVSVGDFKQYPYAYDADRHAHIDPTRRPSHRHGIELSPHFMHHFSYVRKDIDLKINNSSANLSNSREIIYRDLENAREGYFSNLYHQKLQECANYFSL